MPEGAVVPGVARRSVRSAQRCCGRSAAASSIASCRTTRRSTSWRSRSSPRRRAAEYGEDELYRAGARAPGRTATCPARALRRGRRDGGGRLRHEARPPRGADSSRRGQPARPRPARARGCSPSHRAARSRRSPTIEWSPIPTTRSSAPLNEDFAIESSAGDVFQLGNTSWRVLQVGAGVVRVADAKGRAADDSVLARRGAGTERRALARGQRSARGGRGSL